MRYRLSQAHLVPFTVITKCVGEDALFSHGEVASTKIKVLVRIF